MLNVFITSSSKKHRVSHGNMEIAKQVAVIGIAGALSGYHIYSTMKSKDEIDQAKVAAASHGQDAEYGWVREIGVPIESVKKDSVMMNCIDALAIFRYGSPHLFKRVVLEINKFYEFYIAATPLTAGKPQIAHQYWRWALQYTLNIQTLMKMFKNDVIKNYGQVRVPGSLQSRLNARSNIILEMCNGYYQNFIKDCKTIYMS